MADYLIQESTLTGIADAIRAKEGSAAPIATTDFAQRIANMFTGEDLDAEMLTQDDLIAQLASLASRLSGKAVDSGATKALVPVPVVNFKREPGPKILSGEVISVTTPLPIPVFSVEEVTT